MAARHGVDGDQTAASVCPLQGPKCPLQTRILFHCAHKLADEAKLMQYHQQLTESIEDQLSLASIHYQRSHYKVRGGRGGVEAGHEGI